MREISARTSHDIELGKRGENLAACVVFDISDWKKTHGEGVVHLLHHRNGDRVPYPCAVEVKDNCVYWAVTNADTANAGKGRAELQYFVGEVLAKSETYTTIVDRALAPASDEPPAPYEGWVEEVLKAGTDAIESAASAKESAENAEEARQAIENMTASCETLAAGSPATVEKSLRDGVVNLHFGIPKGRDGSGEGGGGGTGDMEAATYDPTGKKRDIFAYADKAASDAAQKAAADVAASVESAAANAAAVAAKTAAEQAAAAAVGVASEAVNAANIAIDLANNHTHTAAEVGAAPTNHSHTAAEVGAVPTAGGTMTGNLSIRATSPQVILNNQNTDRYAVALSDSNGCASLGTHVDNDNIQQLKVRPETYDLNKALQILRIVGGEQKWYNVHHTGNKPSGSYAGSSSSATRTINIGGMGVLLVYSTRGASIVTSVGCFTLNSGIDGAWDAATYADGVLTLNTGGAALNMAGVTYYYQVL